MTDGTFFHGTTCCHLLGPNPPSEEVFRKIQAMGLDTLCIAELCPGWQQIEPRPGAFDFGALDESVDRACRVGLNVVMGIGIANPPGWVFEDNPDLRCVDGKGQADQGRIGSANPDDPRLRQWMERFIDTYARHYADKPLLAWQIASHAGSVFHLPDNPMTHERFRLWLGETWDGDLDRLNRQWRTFYRDWSEIYPYGSAYGAPTGGLTPLALAGRKYRAWSLAELVEWAIAILRRHSALPVFHCNRDISGRTSSHWEVAALGDVVCQNLCPGTPPSQKSTTLLLDLGSSISRTLGKDLWIGQAEIGPWGSWLRNRPDRRQTEAWVVEMLGAGARALLYARQSPSRLDLDGQAAQSQGVLRSDASETLYARTPRNITSLLERMKDKLLQARPIQPKLAVYWPEESLLLSQDAGFEDLQRDAVFGTCSIFNRLGYPLQWFDSEWICAEDLAGYDILYLPTSWLIPEEVGQKIADYVRQGGTLICEGRCGYVDDQGWLYENQPGAGLHEVLGASEDLYWNPEQLELMMVIHNRTHHCKVSRLAQTLRPAEAEVIGQSVQGQPIATQNRYGQGQAVCMGFAPSLLFAAGMEVPNEDSQSSEITQRQETMEMLDDMVWQMGLRRPVNVEFQSRFLSFRYLSLDDDGSVLVFICNHGPQTSLGLGDDGEFLAWSNQDEVIFPSAGSQSRSLNRYDWCIARCAPAEE